MGCYHMTAKKIAHNPNQLGCNVPLAQVIGLLTFTKKKKKPKRETDLSSGFAEKQLYKVVPFLPAPSLTSGSAPS